jgi:hypothetical protein
MALLQQGLEAEPLPNGGATTSPVTPADPYAAAPTPTPGSTAADGGATTSPVGPDGTIISDPPISEVPEGGDPYPPGGDYIPPDPILVPPEQNPDDVDNTTTVGGGDESTTPPLDVGNTGVDVQDLYPDAPEGGEFEVPDVADPTGATVTEGDLDVGNVATPTDAVDGTGDIVDGAISDVTDALGTGEETGLTAEQMVDAELARILGEDSPLLASARQEAMRQMNARGLTNTSMAAGATYKALVDAALPMAQQNAQQAAARELANTENRQESTNLNAEQIATLRALEAELGQELSIFNADQLAQAERLTAELRTAMEQGNMQAYNDAAMQLAELQRDAEAQQADLEGAGEEREFLERQAYQEQILETIGRLNEQFMIGEQQIDLQHVIGTYQQITSMNETAATLMDSYLRSIGSIYDDPDMSTSQAAEAIRAMVSMLEGSMRMIQEMNGMDFEVGGNIPGGSGNDDPFGDLTPDWWDDSWGDWGSYDWGGYDGNPDGSGDTTPDPDNYGDNPPLPGGPSDDGNGGVV